MITDRFFFKKRIWEGAVLKNRKKNDLEQGISSLPGWK
jgi:hypothetical protein